jgi:hypothetical protein
LHKTLTLLALMAAALVASAAAAGKPDIVNYPPIELTAVPQAECGSFELLLEGILERRSRYTVGPSGEDLAEARKVQITGTVYNSTDPAKAAPYFRSIQIDENFVTGERAVIGTTHVVVRGHGIVLSNSGIRIEDWTGVDFETVFPTLLFQGGPSNGFDGSGWDRLCSLLG